MLATARFELDEPYFTECYAEWLREVSRVRRLQPWLGLGIVCAGVLLLPIAQLRPLGAALVTFGVFVLIENATYRRRWIAGRLGARKHLRHREAVIDFEEESISVYGPTSSGTFTWSGIASVRETEKGLRLGLGDGNILYVPKSALVPEGASQTIVERANAALRTKSEASRS